MNSKYIILNNKKKVVKDLIDEVTKCDEIILAIDSVREVEAIAYYFIRF